MEEENNARIYRFKVQNNALFQEMKDFAESHKYEAKDVLKESFENWYTSEEIGSMIAEEENYLMRHCYDFQHNNMKNKIFKSIKYYFIKNMLKSMNLGENEAKCDEKASRKHVVKFTRSFINEVKTYLISSMEKKSFVPKTSYNDFLESCATIISEEKELHDIEDIVFDQKLKKMYKNQYYTMQKGMKQ